MKKESELKIERGSMRGKIFEVGKENNLKWERKRI